MNVVHINWDVEISGLQDLTMTAFESHRLAADLLVNGMAESSDPGQADGKLIQRILMGKLAAESVSALEDLGGWAWSVRNRSKGGILRRYIEHTPGDSKQVHESVHSGDSIRDLLKLPSDSVLREHLSDADIRTFGSGLEGLQRSFKAAAANYLSDEVDIVKAYNKLKHGFIVIVRLDQLNRGESLRTDWKNDVNILTGIRDDGEVDYIALERSQAMADGLRSVISMCADTAKELAYLMMFLWERKIPLDGSS